MQREANKIVVLLLLIERELTELRMHPTASRYLCRLYYTIYAPLSCALKQSLIELKIT